MSASRLQGYRLSSILLHWLAAGLIIALFILGKNAEGAEPTARRALMGLHTSLGALAVLLIALRLGWRFVARDGAAAGAPATAGLARASDIVATAVKHLLYLAMLVVIVTGPLTVWSGGRAIDVFGLFALPSPFGRLEIREALGTVHGVAATALAPLVALHVLGAFKHLIIDRDGVFQRMLVPRR